ncbi:Major facilitator superfamily domain general substrate transporter [Penicillium crustosum]|uniref:Major facilitator superfamily domain general substrate transporter n=1 Tax=Penicillium crustosum TaxID=36656 RepID=UPI00238A2F7D|nr:Major facilitator superfamily domain general substrate transporter [Penicillium crustosum]KAJ5394153.1 Major facilitator superfamily domain general substrate transporter [Penicillium crustosum]
MIQCIFLIFSGLCGALLANYQKSVGALLFVSSVFTAVGVAIFGTLSSDTSNFETKAYGFELLLVIGLGLMMPPIFSSSKSNTTIQILLR